MFTVHQFVLTFESVDEILKYHHSNESSEAVFSSGTVYYVPCRVFLTFESVDGILKCDESNESCIQQSFPAALFVS